MGSAIYALSFIGQCHISNLVEFGPNMVSPFPLSPELQAFEAKPQMWMFYILCLNSIKKKIEVALGKMAAQKKILTTCKQVGKWLAELLWG